jgi:predicted Rossmann fold flavoprotein
MSKQISTDVVVIGAGAAGLLAAGSAAEAGARVLLLERMERPGRKLLITGKGRCNITNASPLAEFLTHVHPSGKFLRTALSCFYSNDIIALLNKYGLQTVTERGNRVFPASNKASDVVHALMNWLKSLNVELITRCRVSSLVIENGKLLGVDADMDGKAARILAKAVIVCTGGKSYPATGSSGDGYKLAQQAGHSIINLRQSLVPLETRGETASLLQGLSLKNINASLWIEGKKAASEFGEMLFTHFGLSGPVILTLSRQAVEALREEKKVEISIDLKPALDENKLDARLIRDLNENGKKHLATQFKEWLPSSMIPVFIDKLGLEAGRECNQTGAKERRKIMLLMKDFRFEITSCRPFKEAIVTAGGVSLKETDSSTLQSKLLNNLYFAGEVLDLDADTGGYNLQIAWSTGWLAGKSVSEVLE